MQRQFLWTKISETLKNINKMTWKMLKTMLKMSPMLLLMFILNVVKVAAQQDNQVLL